MEHIFRLQGIIAAPFTPMDKNGQVRYSVVGEYAERLKSAGVKGVFIGGTTGESLSLSIAERCTLAEAWIGSLSPDFSVIVHAGCDNPDEAEQLSSHAKQIGAAGVGAMPPVFFKPAFDELVAYCKKVAAACDPLPFYYYHIPSMTGVTQSMLTLTETCEREVPNFRGIKFTHNDLMEYSLLNAYGDGKYDILYGRDETILAGLTLGAKGMIGSTYNYAMPVYNALVKAFDMGDLVEARRRQVQVQKIVQVLIAHGGGTVGGKAVIRIAGLNLGPCRPPNRVVDDSEIETIESDLQKAGVLDLLKI